MESKVDRRMSHRNHRNSNMIPIPQSFDLGNDDSEKEEKQEEEEEEISWEECLRLDCAMQCWFVKHKRRSMNYWTCVSILKQYLPWFLNTTIPQVYTLDPSSNNHNSVVLLKANDIPSESRISSLKQLYHSTAATKKTPPKNSMISQFIQSSCKPPKQAKATNGQKNDSPSSVSETQNFIHWIHHLHNNNISSSSNDQNNQQQENKAMTLQERVAARQQQSILYQQSTNSNTTTQPQQPPPHSKSQPLLHIADTIQAQAQQIYRRMYKSKKNNKNSPPPKIPIPLTMLSFSFTQIKQLQQKIPDWIHIHTFPHNQNMHNIIPNDAPNSKQNQIRVVIPLMSNMIYTQTIRNKLLSPQKTNTTTNQTNRHLSTNHNNHKNINVDDGKKRKRNSKLSLTNRLLENHNISSATKENDTSSSTLHYNNINKENSHDTQQHDNGNRKRTKRPLEENHDESQQTKKLRVNPFLHVTDADVDGGILLSNALGTAASTTPRGLKRLFHQMNSGQRI